MANSIVPFSKELAQQLFSSTEEYPVKFDDGWQWLEYSRKDNAKRFFLGCGFVENLDYVVFLRIEENLEGRPAEDIRLTCDCFKGWGMMTKTPKGQEVRSYFLDCERRLKALLKQQPAQPQLTLPEALDVIEKLKSVLEIARQSCNLRLVQQTETIMSQYLDAYIALPGSSLPGSNNPRYEGVIDVAIRLNIKVPSKFESALGRYAGKTIPHLRVEISEENLKDYRTAASSGKRLGAFMYPAFHPEVESCVREYCAKHNNFN